MSDLRSAEAVFAEQEEEVWDLLRAKEYATAAEALKRHAWSNGGTALRQNTAVTHARGLPAPG